jgi:hypothetical protein
VIIESISIFIVICCFILLISIISIFIFIIIVKRLSSKFNEYKKKSEFEKKILGEKKINVNQYIEFSEDDFKIPFKSIKELDEIGQGASAIVFKGKYNNDLIAIKLFKLNMFQADTNDFKKELKLISKLKNRNIVNFIGFVVEDTKFGICLEFCENGSLKTFLEKNKNIDFKEKIRILLDISKGKKNF